jgi:hypothetical protein
MATTRKTARPADAAIHITQLKKGSLRVRVIGQTPLMQNRMSAKVMQGLLVGSAKKTKAEKAAIKHHPVEEYRSAMELMKDGPTAIGLRVVALKTAMCTAALETAGITKTASQRLLFMPGELTALYGTPQLDMRIVRSADMNRTPDVRSRPIFPKWGAEFDIEFVSPQLSAQSVAALLYNAGILIGIGDGRQEKGKLGYGGFRMIPDDVIDDEWSELVAEHARPAQEAAIVAPEFFNDETESLFDFYMEETQRRAA